MSEKQGYYPVDPLLVLIEHLKGPITRFIDLKWSKTQFGGLKMVQKGPKMGDRGFHRLSVTSKDPSIERKNIF